MRKKRFLIILSVIAVVLIVAVAVTALCWPAINRFYRRNFMEPTEYLKMVQTNALENDPAVGMTGNVYDALLSWTNQLSTPKEHTASIHFTSDMMRMLENLDKTGKLKLEWLGTAQMKVITGIDGTNFGADIQLSVNDAQLLNVDAVLELYENRLYAGAPDLNKTYFATDVDTEKLTSVLALFAAVGQSGSAENLPDSQAVEQLLRKYMALFVEQYADAERSTETVKIGKIRRKCTVLQVELSQETVNAVLTRILEDAQKDETAKALLQAYCDGRNLMARQMAENFVAQYNEEDDLTVERLTGHLLEAVQKAENRDTTYIIKTYVDNSENICGRSVETSNGHNVFKMLTATKKNDWEAEVLMGSDVQLRGEGSRADGKLSGTFTVKHSGEDYLYCRLQNIDEAAMEEGRILGTVSLTFSEDMTANILSGIVDSSLAQFAGMAQPTLQMQFAQDSTRIGVQLAGKEYMDITVTTRDAAEYKVQVPEKWVSGNLQGIAKWLKDIDVTKLTDALKSAMAPEQVVNQIEKLIKKWIFMAELI